MSVFLVDQPFRFTYDIYTGQEMKLIEGISIGDMISAIGRTLESTKVDDGIIYVEYVDPTDSTQILVKEWHIFDPIIMRLRWSPEYERGVIDYIKEVFTGWEDGQWTNPYRFMDIQEELGVLGLVRDLLAE